MNWNADFGYEDVPEPTEPKPGHNEVVKVFKADFEVLSNGSPVIRLFGGFPEFSEECRWNGDIWLPRPEERQSDPERYEKSRRRFTADLRAFGVPDLRRGMSAQDIAAGLVGHFAVAKVEEDDYGLKGKFFKKLNKAQAERFQQPPPPSAGGAPTGGQRSNPPGNGGGGAFASFNRRSV